MPRELGLSIVIPVYDERESLRPLYEELREIAARLEQEVELIFVDDGSTDGSWEVLCDLQAADDRISAIRFRRNFGKAAALAAGFGVARGDPVFTLDADLQDDPREIPRFLEQLQAGHDVVSGWKKLRHDPWHKTLPSRVFNRLVGRLTGVRLHDHNCGFKCYRSAVLDEIQLYGELHRFIPVLAHAKGFRVGEIVVGHRPRRYGRSKYGWGRIFRGLVDLLTIKFLTAFQNRPQHMLGGVGLVFLLAGLMGLGYLAAVWVSNLFIADPQPIGGRPLLMYSATAFLFGAQILTIGLLAELVTARNLDPSQVYSIAQQRLSPRRTCPPPEAPAMPRSGATDSLDSQRPPTS